ncbi:hypothetical protein JCM24511_01477 [Saitozyma sp. JCM 24511]|nr:hypothetical protein JCM24511_01477 [Saitozyma sp. JCM 24511]
MTAHDLPRNGELDLVRATLQDVVRALEEGQVTSVELVNRYLARIEADNINGLGLRAVLETAPKDNVLAIAQQLDEERAAGKLRGQLHGIPILIKDAIATGPELGMQTTGGTFALMGSVVPASAPLVQTLMSRGIIILGKANMTVLNNMYGEGIENGWSPRGGQTLSVFGSGHNTGGSSSGSGVGLAAGFAAATIGCETMGSITSPGLHSGTYGLKPTLKLVDGQGIIPITSRQDCAGPMGKSVWDLAALLSSMVVPHTDYTQYLASPNDSLSSYRLGVARGPGFFPFSYSSGLKDDPHSGYPPSEALFADALKVLAPAIALDPAEIPGSETIWERDDEQSCFEDGKWKGRREVLLMVTDMYEDFNTYLAGLRNTSIRTLEDLVGWNKLHPDQAFPSAADPSTAQMFLEYAVETKGIKGEEYTSFLEIGNAVAKSFVDTLDKQNLDAMVFPTWSWAPGVASTGGFPISVMPFAQLESGEPFGLMFVARRGDEGKLIGLMAACERVLPARPISELLQ